MDIANRGIEISLNTNNLSDRSPLKWQTSLNVAFNDNYVTKLPDGNRDFTYGPVFLSRILTIGKPLYGYRVFNINGVYPTTGDVPVDPLTGLRTRIYGGAQFIGGDNAKQDINGDYNVDDNDMIVQGDPNTKNCESWWLQSQVEQGCRRRKHLPVRSAPEQRITESQNQQ